MWGSPGNGAKSEARAVRNSAPMRCTKKPHLRRTATALLARGWYDTASANGTRCRARLFPVRLSFPRPGSKAARIWSNSEIGGIRPNLVEARQAVATIGPKSGLKRHRPQYWPNSAAMTNARRVRPGYRRNPVRGGSNSANVGQHRPTSGQPRPTRVELGTD